MLNCCFYVIFNNSKMSIAKTNEREMLPTCQGKFVHVGRCHLYFIVLYYILFKVIFILCFTSFCFNSLFITLHFVFSEFYVYSLIGLNWVSN